VLTLHAPLLVLDEGIELFRNHVIHSVHKSAVTIHLLNQGHRNHPLAEPFDFCPAADVNEFFLLTLSIIGRFYRERNLDVEIVNCILCEFHNYKFKFYLFFLFFPDGYTTLA